MNLKVSESRIKNNVAFIEFPAENGWEGVALYSIQKLVEELKKFEAHSDVGTIIISPNNNDIPKNDEVKTYEEGIIYATQGQKLLQYIEQYPKPIISIASGNIYNIGFELILSSHFVVASPETKFGFQVIEEGIIPSFGGIQKLVRALGRNKALEVLLLNNILNATQAREFNLVNFISETPEEKALEIATEINKIDTSIRKAIINGINAYEYGESYNMELVNFAKSIEEINNN